MYLGIDLGTQSIKAVLLDHSGQVVCQAQEHYPLYRPQQGWVEQDPNEWWAAAVQVIRSIPAEHRQTIDGIGITGQMHGTVLLDENLQILRPAIIWMDQRSQAQIQALQATQANWMNIAYNRISTGMMGATLRWLVENEPHIIERTKVILFPKDWIRFKLAGTLTTDLSDASGGILLNIPNQAWSTELIEQYGVSPSQFPHLMKSVAIIGEVIPAAAEETGLKSGTRVGVGAGDQAAMLIGSGALDAGQAVLTIGTGGQLSVITQNPQHDPRLNTFCHAVPDMWYNMGAILAAGYALTWWQNTLGADLSTMLEQAAQIAAGSEGLLFRPYLNGERTPHMNPNLTANFEGLTGRHHQGHMTRAVLEGVAYAMRDCLQTLREVGANPNQIIFGGGGSKGMLWRQIMASILNIPLVTMKDDHATAKGAAMLACVGTRHFENLQDAANACITYQETIEPVTKWCEVYEEGYARFQAHKP